MSRSQIVPNPHPQTLPVSDRHEPNLWLTFHPPAHQHAEALSYIQPDSPGYPWSHFSPIIIISITKAVVGLSDSVSCHGRDKSTARKIKLLFSFSIRLIFLWRKIVSFMFERLRNKTCQTGTESKLKLRRKTFLLSQVYSWSTFKTTTVDQSDARLMKTEKNQVKWCQIKSKEKWGNKNNHMKGSQKPDTVSTSVVKHLQEESSAHGPAVCKGEGGSREPGQPGSSGGLVPVRTHGESHRHRQEVHVREDGRGRRRKDGATSLIALVC